MNRFFLSRHAKVDLEQIRAYFDMLPREPTLRVGRDIQKALKRIAENPFLATAQSEFTRLAGVEVRSKLVPSYRIFYAMGSPVPEIIAILHTTRDIRSILISRIY